MQRLVFGQFELRPAERLLLANGLPISVGARAFDVLVALTARRDRFPTRRVRNPFEPGPPVR